MKKITIIILLAAVGLSLSARKIVDKQLPIDNISVTNTVETITLNIDFLFDTLARTSNTEYAFTPVMTSSDGTDSIAFAPFILAGRNLYYRHLRLGNLSDTTIYRFDRVGTLSYTNTVTRQSWMDDADISIRTTRTGCCKTPQLAYDDQVARVRRPVYTPKFVYEQPVPDTIKEFTLEGSAYVNFPVNRTEIYPDYMNNPAELLRITNTIDSVKSDTDITITYISIKGFASPEGSYTNNVRLAKGRTATLKDYVERISNLPHNFIDTDYLPEDWPGLRNYVEKSSMGNRDAILAIIDSNLEPDAKDNKIKRDFPEDYGVLLSFVYPKLRHSDYLIRYNVRSYTSLEEILNVLHTQPQKLSPEEFYRAAKSMEMGSIEYNEVFETAVRMYPNDVVSNLNAANAAMQSGRYDAAARYLDKAGDSPTAIYARGVLAALEKDYTTAAGYFTDAAAKGQPDAEAALEEVGLVQKYANGCVEIIED